MRIDRSGLNPSSKPVSVPADDHSSPEKGRLQRAGTDQVSVSPRARLIALARQALDETPPVRREVVDAARARLQVEEPVWDDQTIAGAIVDTISDDAA